MAEPRPTRTAERAPDLHVIDDRAIDESRALVPMTTLQVPDSLVREQMPRIKANAGVIAFGKEITDVQAALVARVALAYGLDPLAGEVMLLGGKLYVGLDGRLRKANEHPSFDGIECVPASDEERRAFRARDDEDLWKATVYRKDRRTPAVGWGRCSATQETVIGQGGSLVPNTIARRWSQEMAQKRAKHRALRDAFSMPLPGVEERGEDRGAAQAFPQGYEPRGDVIEGEAREVQDVQPLYATADADLKIPIRKDQIIGIHAIVGQTLKWPDEEYREALRRCFGVSSSKELTEAQAAAFLEAIAAEAVASQEEERRPKLPKDLPSLRDLWLDDDRDYYSREAIAARRGEANVIDHEPASVEKPTDEELAEYMRYMRIAQELGLDLAPYETDSATSRADLQRIFARLKATVDDESAKRHPKPRGQAELIDSGKPVVTPAGKVVNSATGELL